MADEDDIFRNLSAPVENVQEYRLGGYHPLHLRDSLLDGRYLVLRKLGYGSYSTTWLAHDRKYVLNPIVCSVQDNC
jgi:serine/threonine-protein kinase SRPK3